MHKYTPHRSLPNLSDGVRWSLDLRFQPTGWPTGRPFWPSFRVRSARDAVDRNYEAWCAEWKNALANSAGERWHRVAGDVGGGVGAVK